MRKLIAIETKLYSEFFRRLLTEHAEGALAKSKALGGASWLTFRVRQDEMRVFFVIALPVVWTTAALTSYFHPGDEGVIFVVSSLAGSWVCFLLPNVGDLLRDVLWLILLTGAVVLGVLGFLMDRLRMSRRLWGMMFGLSFLAILVLSLLQYPSLDRAISKNGSITAYAAGACNIGLYCSVILAFIVKAIAASTRRIRSGNAVEPFVPAKAGEPPR